MLLVSCSSSDETPEYRVVKDSLTEDVVAVEFIRYYYDVKTGEYGELYSEEDSVALSIKYLYDKHSENHSVEYSEYFIRQNRYSLLRKDEVTCDENGNLTELIKYDENQELYSRKQFFYDDTGKEISHDYFDGNGKLLEHAVLTYNKSHDCDIEDDYDSAGKHIRRIISWQKDRVGTDRVIEYNGSNVNEAYQEKYDRYGRVVWINHIATSGHSDSGKIKRNRKGLPIKTVNCEADITGQIN